MPARSDQANGLVQDPPNPHSYRTRAAQTAQHPILATTTLRPLPPQAEQEARAAERRVQEARPGEARPEERPDDAAPATIAFTTTEHLARLTDGL